MARYFIWDTIDSLLNSTIGFVIHGAACLAVYLFSFVRLSQRRTDIQSVSGCDGGLSDGS